MDIKNDTNISNLISNSISKLNLNTKVRTSEQTKTQDVQKQTNDFEVEDRAFVENNKKTNGIDVKEIQKYAQIMGEELTVEDINYGLMYGRSVIADYTV